MEALGRMAGGIAHDFNNLLTVINSWAELLMEEPGLSTRVQRGMAQIKEAGHKATGLTRQLLAFTRRQLVERKTLNLNDRVTDIVELMKRVIGEDINLVVTLDPSLGLIKADPGQIEQVVMNLVVNARDAMPHGGRLELETTEVSIVHSDPFWPDPLTPGPYMTLVVRDTGCGMDADTLAHMFEPFFTDEGTRKGNRPGSLYRVRHCQAERWHGGNKKRTGKRHELHDLPAACRPAGRSTAPDSTTGRDSRDGRKQFCSSKTTTWSGDWLRPYSLPKTTPCYPHVRPRKHWKWPDAKSGLSHSCSPI